MSRWTKSNWRWLAAAIAGGVILLLLVGGAIEAALDQSPVCEQPAKSHHSETDALSAAEAHEPGPNEDNAHASEQQPHFCYRGHTAEEWIGILTAILAGVTWALVMATGALWLDARFNGEKQLKAAASNLRIAHRQLQSAQKSTVEQLAIATRAADAAERASFRNRAWVSVEFMFWKRLHRFMHFHHRFAVDDVTIRLRNMGQTPATIISVDADVYWTQRGAVQLGANFDPTAEGSDAAKQTWATPFLAMSLTPPVSLPTSADAVTQPPGLPPSILGPDRDPLDGASANPVILEAGQILEPLVASTFQFDGVENGKDIGDEGLIAAAIFLRVVVKYRDVYQMDRETIYFARIHGRTAQRVRKDIHDRVNRQT